METNHSDDVIDKCEKIIKQIENNSNSKPQKEKIVFSSEETFNDENVFQAIDCIIEENNKLKDEEKAVSKSNNEVLDLNDSFNEEIALLEQNDIKILQNITIMEPKQQELPIDSDEEIFSDIDLVENTPPKRRNRSQLKQEQPLDLILPPPPEFQEDEAENSRNLANVTLTNEINTEQEIIDKTYTENMRISSITPDFLSPPQQRSQPVKEMGTSTPLTGKMHSLNILSISPITSQKRNQTPFEAAKNIKGSTLTVVAKAPPTSTKTVVNNPPKQQKSILNYVKPNVTIEKPCITCSRLRKDQMIAVSALTNKKLATYTSSFAQNVTHVIVAVNENNCVKDHTIKYVCGVAAGLWIVSFKWIQECLTQNRIVSEEPFEVKDVSGVDGPRQSRLTRTINPLLKGFKVFAAPPFRSTTQEYIEMVVRLLGGKVVDTANALLPKQGYICLIISEASETQDFEMYENWLEQLKVISVDIEWLSRSVGQYKIINVRPYRLCSEDTLDNLGYPEEMVASMSSSTTPST